MIEEQVLIQRAQKGEIPAFRELVERYKKNIYYVAYDLTNNHHSAEDLSQEVFIKMYNSLKNFRSEAKLNSWLYRITVNTFLSQQRKKSFTALKLWNDYNEQDMDEKILPESNFQQNPEQDTEKELMQQNINKALEKLSAKERSVFVLRHYKDMPLKEIAEILKITVGTIKSTLFRATKKLQNELSFYQKDLGLEDLK